MSKHENILDFQSVAVPRPGELSSIGAIFAAWLSASDTAHDPKAPQAAKDRAKERMSMLWDEATDLLARDAQDVAAIYIMAQRTIAIDPEGYMESAWRMVHAASGEAELVSLYDVWRKLEATIEASNGNDTDLTAMCDVGRGIEDRIAAIPATTARGLAIKVDVGRHHDKGSVMEQSLAADLAALTGNPVRPE